MGVSAFTTEGISQQVRKTKNDLSPILRNAVRNLFFLSSKISWLYGKLKTERSNTRYFFKVTLEDVEIFFINFNNMFNNINYQQAKHTCPSITCSDWGRVEIQEY